MDKGFVDPWLELLHHPFLPLLLLLLVVLAVELAIGHDASKLSPNKIKPPWSPLSPPPFALC
jgi:hypothetical protein